MSSADPTAAELIDRLASIGIEEREAKLFVHLCLQGPSRASEAAAATHLKRTETYRALEALMKRGFVTAQLTRPVVYEAVSPETLFRELINSHEQRRTDIERLHERVTLAVEAVEKEDEGASALHAYKMVQGRRAILSTAETTIRNARRIQRMVSTVFGAHHTSPKNRAYQTMLARAAEGLSMEILLRPQPGLERALEEILMHENVEVRFADLDHPARFISVDEREVIYWLVSDPSVDHDASGDVAMWTNAPDFVASQDAFFQTLWAQGRPAQKLGANAP